MKDFTLMSNAAFIGAKVTGKPLATVANAAGISVNTLRKVASRDVQISFNTAEKLKNFFGKDAVKFRIVQGDF